MAGPTNGAALIEVWDEPGEGARVRVWRDAPGRGMLVYRMAGRGANGVIVSSEIDWLLKNKNREVHATRLARALASLDRHDRSTQDFIKGVHRVRPGHLLEVSANGVAQWSWWGGRTLDLARRVPHAPALEPQVRQFVEALDEAVAQNRVQGEKKRVGFAVSSGLDSTLLAMRFHAQRGAPNFGEEVFWGTMSFPRAPSSDEAARTKAWVEQASTGVPWTTYDMSEVGALGEGGDGEGLEGLGAPLHPGERYEANFLRRFVEEHALDEVWTGVGADQLFDVHPLDALRAFAHQGEWETIVSSEAWRPWLGGWGVLQAWGSVQGQELWHALAPRRARQARVRHQLESLAKTSPFPPLGAPLHLDLLAASRVEEGSMVDEARRVVRFMESWEWEGLMRTILRLERAVGVPVRAPYLDESLWRWRALDVSADRCMAPVGAKLYNKYLLRCAHALFHKEAFPGGFAWRGKAAVFDEHIRVGLMGRERGEVERLIAQMGLELGEYSRSRWSRVLEGELGRPLVELARSCAAQRWLLRF